MTSMIYPTTNPAMSETMVVARAEGPYIYDKQGKRYLEGWPGCGAQRWAMATRRSLRPRNVRCVS